MSDAPMNVNNPPPSEERTAGDQLPTDEPNADELTTDEVLRWGEFACWTILALAPILYYINGPSVSTDQAVVRTALVVVAIVGAILLRLVNWRRSKMRPSA